MSPSKDRPHPPSDAGLRLARGMCLLHVFSPEGPRAGDMDHNQRNDKAFQSGLKVSNSSVEAAHPKQKPL